MIIISCNVKFIASFSGIHLNLSSCLLHYCGGVEKEEVEVGGNEAMIHKTYFPLENTKYSEDLEPLFCF